MLAGVALTLSVLGVIAIVLWAQHVTVENDRLKAEKEKKALEDQPTNAE